MFIEKTEDTRPKMEDGRRETEDGMTLPDFGCHIWSSVGLNLVV
jgi:hypothetical protein